MSKYKYYFRKPRSEIAKDIMKGVLLAGVLVAAGGGTISPSVFWRGHNRWRRYARRDFYNTFYRLKKRGYLKIERRGYDLKVSLTPEGKKAAGWLQIDALQVKRPRKWDKRWRLVIFDIAEFNRQSRDAFRGKLRELGFRCVQKSVWLNPFNCQDEIELLKDFFGLRAGNILLLTVINIPNEAVYKKEFGL